MKLFSVLGIEIKINYLLIPIVILSVFSSYFFEFLIVFSIIIFHELGHSLVAYYYNVHIFEIEIFPFGGVAKTLTYIETRPLQEMAIAGAGPVVNVILYAVALMIKTYHPIYNSRMEFFLLSNLTIFIFNLMPVLPLDGGRIVRAALAKEMGIRRATKAIILLGKLLCMAIFVVGIFLSLQRIDNIFLCGIGIFLYYQTHQEKEKAAFAFMQELVAKKEILLYKGVMDAKYLIALESIEIHKVLKEFVDGKYHIVTIVDQRGRIIGNLSEGKIIDAMIKYGSRESLGSIIEIMKNKED